MDNPVVAILLFVIGLGLIFVEIMIPGGVVGTLGFLAAIAGVIMGFMGEDKTLGIVLVIIGVCFVPIVIVLWLKVLRRVFAINASLSTAVSVDESLKSLVGQEGISATPLHPAGKADIAGKRVDVVTGGELIAEDTRVTVVEVKGNRVVVRAVSAR